MAQLVYELSFKGAASETLAGTFEGCRVTSAYGITVLRSEVPDQAALPSLINRVHALGLDLLDLHLVAEHVGDDSWAVPPFEPFDDAVHGGFDDSFQKRPAENGDAQ